MVNGDYALEQVFEQKVNGSRVPDYRIAQRRREEGRRGERQERVWIYRFLKFKWSTGHRVSSGQWVTFEQPDWTVEIGWSIMALKTKERFDGKRPFLNKVPGLVSSAIGEGVSYLAEVVNVPHGIVRE